MPDNQNLNDVKKKKRHTDSFSSQQFFRQYLFLKPIQKQKDPRNAPLVKSLLSIYKDIVHRVVIARSLKQSKYVEIKDQLKEYAAIEM